MHRGAPLFQASEMQRAQSWRERPAHVHLCHFLQDLYLKAQGAAVQVSHEKKSSWDQSTALQIIWNHKASCWQDKFLLSMNLTTQDRTSSVQSLSHVWLFVTPWTAAHQAFLSITTSRSLLKLMSIEPVKPSNHLILCCPLLLPPLIFPSVRVQFSKESALRIRWSKYWIFSFSLSPSNEYSGLISFRMDWLDLLAVQRTLKSLLQHHSSKASVLQCSAFFMVQLSHPYLTTGKTIALTRRTFVGKVSNWKGPLGSFCFLRRNMSLNGLREIVKDREAWGTAVYGVTESQTWLNNWTTTGQQDIPCARFLWETNDNLKVLWLLLSPTKTSYQKDLLFCL